MKTEIDMDLDSRRFRISDIGIKFNLTSSLMTDSILFMPKQGGSNIRLSPISFITDIGLSAHLWAEPGVKRRKSPLYSRPYGSR
jgi:hypothetical protein